MAINLDIMILKLLSEEDMYGHQIVVELRKVSDEFFSLKTGTVYPLLRTMVSDNMLETFEKEAAGKVRTHYKITPSGQQRLSSGVKKWTSFYHAVNKVLKIN